MKKRVIALALAAAMALSLCACGKPSGGSSSGGTTTPPAGGGTSANQPSGGNTDKPKDTITLQFWGGVQGEYGYDALVENFNKEFADKGIQIEYTRYVNDADGNLQLDTYLSGGDNIDIFMSYGGNSRYNDRMAAGLYLPLSEGLKARGFDPVEELGENNIAGYRRDGEFYAMPTKTDNQGWLMVNVEMFQEAGLEIPINGWTFSEYLDACKKLTKGEGADKTYAVFYELSNTTGYVRAGLWSPMGTHRIYKDDAATETNFTDPTWINGLQLIKDTMDQGYAYKMDEAKADGLSFTNTYLEGKCAMALSIANMRLVRDLETYPHDFTTALVPFPIPDNADKSLAKHPYSSGAGDLICINSKTKYPEECLDFIVWYIKGGMAPLAAGGRIPLWKGFDSSLVAVAMNEGAEGAFMPESIASYLGAGEGRPAGNFPTTPNDGKIQTIFDEEFEAIMYGQKTVEQGMTDAKTRADALLK